MSTSNFCEFTYSIRNCEGSKEYRILYIISIIVWFIPCFLIWCGISSFARIIYCFVMLFNSFSGYPVIRDLISTFSWLPGFMGIHSFIAGMFQSILRMKFEQFTTSPSHRTFESVINENNDNRNRSTTVWIPKGYQVTITFWTLIILLFALTTTFSIIMGLNRNIVRDNNAFAKHNKAFLYANGFLHGTFWFNCTLVIIILIYHGRNLVRMIKESFALTGIQDASNRNVSERIKGRLENAKIAFEAYVIKIRIFNYSIFILMLWFSISLIPITVIYEKLFSALWVGLLFTAVSNFLTPTCLLAVLIGILKAELNPDQEEATAAAVIELNEMNSYFSDVDSSEV
ncbi:hypothetical protein RclHR1_05820010 [Rhizophagus clarus]|uniref:G-protein coupled receptors family 1 profile domain-containing protein n=1 Tax=Rhizophagus clarus TaxID=94130 RepID=A0A2Z6RNW1_9GLOM|nr:hypothetical protein RclHR1_05820010 [Rhizophagus clarus]